MKRVVSNATTVQPTDGKMHWVTERERRTEKRRSKNLRAIVDICVEKTLKMNGKETQKLFLAIFLGPREEALKQLLCFLFHDLESGLEKVQLSLRVTKKASPSILKCSPKYFLWLPVEYGSVEKSFCNTA